jgi:endo-1,4-beta-xylanase
VLLTCASVQNQRWNTINGSIRGPGTNTCLDDGAGLNGSRVFMATCNGSSHQRWSGLVGPDTWRNLGSGRCLDADTATIGQDGTKVQVWDCVGLANKHWSFEFVGEVGTS